MKMKLKRVMMLAAVTPGLVFGQMLVRPWSQTNEALEKRVAADFPGRPSALVHYEVPAMSDLQRLEDVYPYDGIPGGTVTITAAKGEYEPGSFLVYPFEDLGKVQLELGEFKRDDGKGTFPKENLDLKVVKVWYQNGNGWYSYFGDCGNKLCPELLLNDEDLIRVDTAKKANYARITQPDGSVREKWINPPRQMDRIYPEYGNAPNCFQPMRPGFADAKTLQPVLLKKGAFRNFFLTAHVTKDIPAGLYRGEVKVKGQGRQWNIPVELKVLDFELPEHPGTYADPDKEFLTSNYGYISIPLVMAQNGGDSALARKQIVAIFRNLVSHGQSMLKNRTGIGGEGDFTFKAMREAGMRTDLYNGGAHVQKFTFPDEHREELREHAKYLAAALDRRIGHHNLYISHGDEPGTKWIVDNRPVFEAYQDVGFKFLIAGSDNVFNKAGHFYDWHNIAKDPVDDSTARLWSQMAGNPALAWYSTMHVGPENPAFNRRQYGMAAYLSGLTAICNYAHHLGPYNDDTTTYRPMVFAYGSADGVIDTLAWEGYREAVDDMRYATVMCKLARAAVADGTRKGRVAGNIALMYLARFDKASGDLNSCRAEMVDHILRLKKYLGPKADEVLAKCPAAPKAPAKVEIDSPKVPTAESLHREMRYAEESELLEKEGKVVEAAKAILNYEGYKQPCLVDDEPRLERLFRRILAEGLGKPSDRAYAASWLFLRGAAGEETYLQQAIGKDPGGFARALDGQLWRDYGGVGKAACPFYYGRWDDAVRAEKLIRSLVTKPGKPLVYDFKQAYPFAMAYAATGDFEGMRAVIAAGLANKRLKPEQRETLELANETIGRPADAAGLVARARKTDEKAFDLVGCIANVSGDETLLRAFAAAREVYKEGREKKTYTVRFSDHTLAGVRDWDRLDPKPEVQPFDRKFGGGSLAFMVTDVATGDRGEAAAAVKGAKPSTLQVATDEWGIHIRLEAFDPRAKEFAAGLLDFGSFECYLAPGENQPSSCIVLRLRNPAKPSLFGTTYSTPGHRRVNDKDPNLYRNEVYFTDEGAVAYAAFAWENFATLVPTSESVWDFEAINWGPTKSAWNGTESIHGRSTWGKLAFEMPEAARLRILRRQIHLAVREFRAQDTTGSGFEGDFNRWRDPELGDPVFYYREVKPLVDRLEAAAKRATADMSDETVKELAENYLAQWRDIRFTVQRLRTEFLKLRIKDERGDEPAAFARPWKAKAICIDPPATKNLDRFCSFITDRLGPDGFKTLVLRVRYRYQFESHPDCRGTDPLSKADLAKILAACRKAGVKLVPKINLLSHQEGLDDGTVKEGILKAHPEFDECRERGGKVRSQSRHTICPLAPGARQIALDLALELAAACEADTFHLGCDEALDFGLCSACRAVSVKWGSKGNAQLFADWVNGLSRGLKEKGVSTMIWADRLASCDVMRLDAFQACDNGMWRALPLLDKDIVLCDWHYWPAEGYPSVDLLQDAGFTTWLAVWNKVRGSKVFLNYARQHDRGKIAGVMFTTWYGADRFLDAFEDRLSLTKAEDPDGKVAEKVKGEVEVYRLLAAEGTAK